MAKKASIFILIWLTSWLLIAQCEDVGYDDRPIELNYRTNLSTNVRNVPLTVHVIQDGDGQTNLDLNHALEAIEDFNEQSAFVDLFVCNINYINNREYWYLEGSEHTALRTQYNDPNTMNMYFTNTVISPFSGNSVCGFAYYPTSFDLNRGVSVIRNSCANNNNGTTIAHELGHNFDNRHVHSSSELVDRENGNCGWAGDGYCDTPASPTLSTGNVNLDCEYVGNATDSEGVPYEPDPTNFMGFSRKSCRVHFSDEQEADHAQSADFYLQFMGCNALSTPTYDIQKIKVTPNPFNNYISISSKVKYKLYDLTGKLLNLGESDYIDTSELSNGVYLLKIEGQVFKLVK